METKHREEGHWEANQYQLMFELWEVWGLLFKGQGLFMIRLPVSEAVKFLLLVVELQQAKMQIVEEADTEG